MRGSAHYSCFDLSLMLYYNNLEVTVINARMVWFKTKGLLATEDRGKPCTNFLILENSSCHKYTSTYSLPEVGFRSKDLKFIQF